jgi:Rrf2 family iron-sulfur cluster assembly transcriptional regulator
VKLSRESRYAIMGLAVLASEPPGTILQVSQVSETAALPATFLAKIFAKLTHHGILVSHRGKHRGYSLARPPEETPLREVLEAVDGPDLFRRCIFWTETCDDDNPCPLHERWRSLRPLISDAMEQTTLADVALGQDLAGSR